MGAWAAAATRRFRLGVVLLAGAGSLWQCVFYAPERPVEVLPPPLPLHWRESFPELTFRLICPTAEGRRESTLVVGATATVRLAKGTNLPVLAVPLARGGRVELPPAGALLPQDLAGQRLQLRWEAGPLAATLERVWRAGVDLSGLDGRRLAEELQARCGEDPWCVDLDRLAVAAAQDRLRVTDIQPAAATDLQLSPGAGRWFLESPFRTPVPVAAGQTLIISQVPLGVHRLFAPERREWLLIVLGERDLEWRLER